MSEILIDGLAIYRLWKLAADDLIFEKPRAAFDAWADRRDLLWPKELLRCPWCLGLWLAIGVACARKLAPGLWSFAARILAASAVAGGIAEAVRRLEER